MKTLQKHPILLYCLAGASWLVTCIFFYWLYTAYDGAVESGIFFFLFYPLLFLLVKGLGVDPVRDRAAHDRDPDPNSLVSRICILLLFCLVFGYIAILVQNPYRLSNYSLFVFLIFIDDTMLFAQQCQKRGISLPDSDSVLGLCIFEIISTPLLILTALCYLAVVQPMPLVEAKAAAPQGMTYISLSNYERDDHPLGLYYFSDYKINDTNHPNRFYIDVLTGEEVIYN